MQKHKNRPFVIAMLILLVLLIAGLAGMGLWMGKEMGSFDLERILARLTGQTTNVLDEESVTSPNEVFLPLLVEEIATSEPDQVVEATVEVSSSTAEVQNTPVAPVGTQVDAEDVSSTETTAVAETTETSDASDVSADTTSAETTELPDTGIMDELGLPITLGIGVSLVVAIMLLKRLKSSL